MVTPVEQQFKVHSKFATNQHNPKSNLIEIDDSAQGNVRTYEELSAAVGRSF